MSIGANAWFCSLARKFFSAVITKRWDIYK
jgi:hypothetical protein